MHDRSIPFHFEALAESGLTTFRHKVFLRQSRRVPSTMLQYRGVNVRFELRWSPDARDHVAYPPAHQRAAVVDGAERHLTDRPDKPTRRRRLLREYPLAVWELKLGDLRVFYNVDAERNAVEVMAVGVKEHNRLFIGGEEIEP